MLPACRPTENVTLHGTVSFLDSHCSSGSIFQSIDFQTLGVVCGTATVPVVQHHISSLDVKSLYSRPLISNTFSLSLTSDH